MLRPAWGNPSSLQFARRSPQSPCIAWMPDAAPGAVLHLALGGNPTQRQGSVAGLDHTCRARAGGVSETLFSLAQEDSDMCLFSMLSLTQRLFCLSSISGDKMT